MDQQGYRKPIPWVTRTKEFSWLSAYPCRFRSQFSFYCSYTRELNSYIP